MCRLDCTRKPTYWFANASILWTVTRGSSPVQTSDQTSRPNVITWGIEGETPEQRATRINALLVDSTRSLDDARVRLALETDATPFIEKFHELYEAFRTYVNLMADVAQGNVPQPILETKQK